MLDRNVSASFWAEIEVQKIDSRKNSSCLSVNYETGLCVLFTSSAEIEPGELYTFIYFYGELHTDADFYGELHTDADFYCELHTDADFYGELHTDADFYGKLSFTNKIGLNYICSEFHLPCLTF
jgi:hypothetical protein